MSESQRTIEEIRESIGEQIAINDRLVAEDVWLGQYEHIHDFAGWELFYEYRTIED